MIRPYTAADENEVLDIWYRASVVAHSFLPDAFFPVEREQLKELWLPKSETTVWDGDAGVLGFLSLIGNEVGGLFVDPDHQRGGIGRALLDQARESRPVLELSVFEENSLGRSFYAACGFEEIGRQMNEDTGCPELRLRLRPG